MSLSEKKSESAWIDRHVWKLSEAPNLAPSAARGSRNDTSYCEAAARKGDLTWLKALRSWGFPWNQRALIEAGRGGDPEMIQWMLMNGAIWSEQVVDAALEEGKREVYEWAKDKGLSPRNDNFQRKITLVYWAAKHGKIEELRSYQAIREIKADVWDKAVEMAIHSDHPQAIKALELSYKWANHYRDPDFAVMVLWKRNWPMFDWMVTNRLFGVSFGYSKNSLLYAAMQTGDIDAFERMEALFKIPEKPKKSAFPCEHLWCDAAMKSNSVAMARHVMSRNGNYLFDKDKCFTAAALSGSIEVVKFLWEHHKPNLNWNGKYRTPAKSFLAAVAILGHVEVLEWLIKAIPNLTLELNWQEVHEIVNNGHWKVVEWMVSEPVSFPATDILMIGAVKHLSVEVLSKITKLGFQPEIWDFADAMFEAAAASGRIDSIEWMLRDGYGPTDVVCEAAVKAGQYHTLKWAIERGMPYGPSCVTAAVANGDLDCLKLLALHKAILCERHVRQALNLRHWVMAKWMIDNGCRFSSSAIPKVSQAELYPFVSMEEITGVFLPSRMTYRK